MAITTETVIDQITILENGIIQIRQTKRVFDDDGSKLGERFHRSVLEPGDNVSALPNRIQRIAQAVWTQAVIDAYRAARAAALAASPV
jgi:hypothetical protein